MYIPSPVASTRSLTAGRGIGFHPSASADITSTYASSPSPRKQAYIVSVLTPAMITPSKDSTTATGVTTFSVGTAGTNITGANGSPSPVIGTGLSNYAAIQLVYFGPFSGVIASFLVIPRSIVLSQDLAGPTPGVVGLFFGPFFMRASFFRAFTAILISQLPATAKNIVGERSNTGPRRAHYYGFLSGSLGALRTAIHRQVKERSGARRIEEPTGAGVILGLSKGGTAGRQIGSFFVPLRGSVVSPYICSLGRIVGAVSEVGVGIFMRMFLLLIYLSRLDLATRGGVALSKGIASRRNAPLSLMAVTIRGAISNACASSDKLCSLRMSPNGRAFIISSLKCRAVGASLSLRRSGALSFGLRRDSMDVDPIRICKGARSRRMERDTLSIGTLSIGPIVGSLGDLGRLIGHADNIGVHRRKNMNSSFSLSVGNLSNGSIHCFVSNIPLSDGKDCIALTGLPIGLVSQIRVCGNMMPTSLKASTLNKTIGVVARTRGGDFVSTSCDVNSFRARHTGLGTRFVRQRAKLIIHPTVNVDCSGGSCQVGSIRVHGRANSRFVCNGPGHFRSNCFSLLTRVRTKVANGF